LDKVLSGKPVAAKIRQTIKDLISSHDLHPAMSMIQIGNDPASEYYVQNIVSSGAKLNCRVDLTNLPSDASQKDLIALINTSNMDTSIHGIMLQRPLPKTINEYQAGLAVHPDKDIDCLNPINQGKIVLGEDGLLPCTPLAVLIMLAYYHLPVSGSNVVIVGRSPVVGKPLANMLLWKKPFANASVTICHSQSRDIASIISRADIVVAAIGQSEFIDSSMIKKNAILIDVGINEIADADGKNRYVGDIDYNSCYDKALAISPVPGGVGSVTTALLFLGLVKACLISSGINKTIDDFLGLILSDK
jgi:methylenetetrahydrofolate dehydrogenase (NADP+) / methenyltetrahydrofolate cyclohydrolase